MTDTTLTRELVNELFLYVDGDLLWRIAQSSKAALSDEEIDAVVEKFSEKLEGWDYAGLVVIKVDGYTEYEFARAILARAGIGESRHE